MNTSMRAFKVDFIGIGAHRSGTVWIDTCLGEHPEICCSSVKEPSFFINDELYRGGLDAYASLFKNCDLAQSIRGEFSPDYLTVPGTAQRIKNHFPHSKMIACLRNPIERMYSHYLLKRSMGRLSDYPAFDLRFIESVEGQRYLKLGMYANGLIEYFELFRRDQVLVVITEDIQQDPVAFMQKIYAFLGVDSNFTPPSVHRRINFYIGGNRVRSLRVDRAIMRCKPLLKRMLGSRRAAPVVRFLRFLNRRRHMDSLPLEKKPPMDAEVRAYLKERYAKEIEDVSRLIGRDMRGLWK